MCSCGNWVFIGLVFCFSRWELFLCSALSFKLPERQSLIRMSRLVRTMNKRLQMWRRLTLQLKLLDSSEWQTSGCKPEQRNRLPDGSGSTSADHRMCVNTKHGCLWVTLKFTGQEVSRRWGFCHRWVSVLWKAKLFPPEGRK